MLLVRITVSCAPTEQEAGHGTERAGEVDIVSTGMRIGGCEFGVAQSSGEREHASQCPHEKQFPHSGNVRKYRWRRLENRRPNDNAHNQTDRIPQAQVCVFDATAVVQSVFLTFRRFGVGQWGIVYHAKFRQDKPVASTLHNEILFQTPLICVISLEILYPM